MSKITQKFTKSIFILLGNNEQRELLKSIKERRAVYIDTNREDVFFFRMDKRYPSKKGSRRPDKSYLGIVVNELIRQGLLFELIRRNGHGYFLQA